MAATTHFCSIAHVACRLGEDLELLEAIVGNDDTLACGNIVSVHIAPDDYITAPTDDGVHEPRDMLASARVSVAEWRSPSRTSSPRPSSSPASRPSRRGGNRDGVVAALPRRHRDVPRSWMSEPRNGEDGK